MGHEHVSKVLEWDFDENHNFRASKYGCTGCDEVQDGPFVDDTYVPVDHTKCGYCFGCKAKGLQLNTGDAGRDIPDKKWNSELGAYREARQQGIQPAGTRIWADDNRYEGEWYEDARQGRGVCVYAADGGCEGMRLRVWPLCVENSCCLNLHVQTTLGTQAMFLTVTWLAARVMAPAPTRSSMVDGLIASGGTVIARNSTSSSRLCWLSSTKARIY